MRRTGYPIAALCTLAVLAAAALAQQPPERRPIDFEKVITNAKEKVFPALVFVKPIRESYKGGKKERQQVFGSGVILTPDGLCVTNQHVVDKAIQINCVLWNKHQVDAELIGEDKETDLALLRLKWDSDEELPWAGFADSDEVTEGQFVMALGAPFGFTRSISLGILSNTQRYIGFRTMYKYSLWLQTDSVINPGNSGGPLVDTHGRIVGINTLKFGYEGLGMAIPSNDVQRVVARLRADGKVVRAWTGLDLQALVDFESNTFIDSPDGVLIKGVEERSPAQASGLASGDVLLAVGEEAVHGKYVEQLPHIRWALADLPPEEPVTLKVRRAGKEAEFTLTPVLKGEVEGEDFDCKRWNMTLKGITKHANPTLYFFRKQGVFVRAVAFPGNAAESGLKGQDILVRVGDREIEAVADVKAAYDELLADEEREKKVLMMVLRNGIQMPVVLDYRRDYEKED